jgi:hypothetical protein
MQNTMRRCPVPEEWLYPSEALALLRERLGISEGRAKALVEQAIASREVQLRPRLSQIPMPEEWFTKVKVILEGGSIDMVQLNRADLVDWVSREGPQQVAAATSSSSVRKLSKPRTRELPTRTALERAFRAEWPDGVIPPGLKIMERIKRIDRRMREDGSSTLSDTTIRRYLREQASQNVHGREK